MQYQLIPSFIEARATPLLPCCGDRCAASEFRQFPRRVRFLTGPRPRPGQMYLALMNGTCDMVRGIRFCLRCARTHPPRREAEAPPTPSEMRPAAALHILHIRRRWPQAMGALEHDAQRAQCTPSCPRTRPIAPLIGDYEDGDFVFRLEDIWRVCAQTKVTGFRA